MTNELLLHYGVKGMKWGVRKDRNNVKSNKLRTRVKEEVGSISQKLKLRKQVLNANNMSTKDINKLANRLRLENDLDRLSKSVKVGKNFIERRTNMKINRKAYRTRGEMTDKKLTETVNRLKAMELMSNNYKQYIKREVDFGKRALKNINLSSRVANIPGVSNDLLGQIVKNYY